MSSGHGGPRPGAGAKKGSGWSPEAKERNRLRRLGLAQATVDAAPESNVVQMREEVQKAASTERGSMQSRRAIAALEYVGRKRAVVSPFRLPEFPPQAIPKDKKLRMAMDSAGSWADGQYAQFAGTIMANVVGSGLVFLGYPFLSELALRPEYRVISETIADDATRKWIDFDVVGEEADEDREKERADEEQALLRGQPIDADERKNRREDRVKKAGKTDKVKELRDDQERLALRDNMYSVCRNDGFFGRSHLFLNFGQDWDNISDLDELKTPIGDGRDETSKGKVRKDSFTEVVVAEPVWTYPTTYNAINPLRKDFYNPQVWYVQGMEIHCTRLLKFIGHEVPDLLKPSFAFGGLSLSQMAKPYVDIWLTTRESVGQLIHSFSVMVLKTDLQTILQGTNAADLEARVNAFNALRDNAGTFVVNKDTEDFANVSASLSGLHELQAQSQEHMMSVVRIPATKFTGIQPSGLQTTSEGEIRAYYDTIAAYQNRFMRPNLTRVVNFQQLSLWGEIDPGITFDFEPLWETSEKELKELQKMEAERHQVYVDLGAISNEEVRGIIIDDPKLPYGHLDPEDVPDLRQEEEEGLEPEGGRPDPLAEAGPGLGQDPDAAAGGQEKPGGEGGKGGGPAPKGGPGGSGAGGNQFPPLDELAGENDNSPFSMARDAGFSESDHPRAPDGRFGSKPGQHGGEGPGHASGAGGLTSAGAGWKGPGPFPWWMEGLGGRGEESFVPAAKPVDPSKLKRVGPQMGSNPGGVFQTQDGDRLYVKQGKTKDHVRNEVTAAALYRLAGAPTLTYRSVEGGDAVATVMEKLDKDNASKLSPEEIKRARRDFATHAWLANYDAVGTGGDNLVTIHGVPTAVDLGGALEYRARGAPKGDQFGDKVAEIDTMRDPHIAPDASRIFKGITAAEFRESAQRVAAVTDAEIRETVAENGGKPELADKLIKRRDDVAERAKHFGSSGDPKKATSSVVFAAGDELPVKELNGVKFEAWTPPKDDDWNDVEGQADDLEGDDPLPEHLPKNKKLSSGLVIREKDGRIWLAQPKNMFGGYAATYPKGRVEPGLSLQANAIKEAFEETGLKGRITGVAGTSEGDMTWTRYYFAERESGDPSKPGPESDGVVLAPADRLDEFLNRKRDRDLAKHIVGDRAMDDDEADSLSRWRAVFESAGLALDEASFQESKHPRDSGGKFSGGSGAGAAGTSLEHLFSGSMGIARRDMPQIPNRFKAEFIGDLRRDGIDISPERVDARTLAPTQADFNEANIARMREGLESGALKDNPIIVSRDGRVLDGHHRWAIAAQDDDDIDVVRVDLPMNDLLGRAKEFSGSHNVAARDEFAFDDAGWNEGKHPRGQPGNKGQFGSGGGGGAQKPAPRQPQRQAPQRPAGAGGKVLAGREAKMAEQQQVFKRHLAEQMAKATPEQKAKHAKHVAKTREFFSGDGTRTATAAAVKGWIAKHAAGVAEHHLRAAVMMPVVHHAVEAAMEHVGLGAVPGATLAVTAIAAYSVHHVMHEFNISLGGAKDLLVSTVKGIAATISGTAEVMSEVAQLEHRMMAGDAKPKADATGMLEPLLELLAGLEALSDEDDPFSDDGGGESGKSEQAADEAPFEEGKHPRDKDGKFATSGSGGGGAAEAEEPAGTIDPDAEHGAEHGAEHPETEEENLPVKVENALTFAKKIAAGGAKDFWGYLSTEQQEDLVNHFGTGNAVVKAVTGEEPPVSPAEITAKAAAVAQKLAGGESLEDLEPIKRGQAKFMAAIELGASYAAATWATTTEEDDALKAMYGTTEGAWKAISEHFKKYGEATASENNAALKAMADAKVDGLVKLYGEQLDALNDGDNDKANELAKQIAEYDQDVKDAAWKIHTHAKGEGQKEEIDVGALKEPAKGAKKTKFGGLWKETGNGEIADFAANSQIVLNKKAFGGSSYRQMLAFLVKKSESGLADKTITDKLKAKLIESLWVAQAKAVSLGKVDDAAKLGGTIDKLASKDPDAAAKGWSDYNANNGGAPVAPAAAQEPATVFNAAGVAKWSPKFYADAIKIGNKYGTGSLDSGLEKAKAAVAAGDATAEALEAMLTANEKYELDKYYGKGNGVKAAYTSAQEDVGLSSQAKEQSDFAKKLINQSKGPSEAAKAALANVTPEALKKAKKSTPIPSGMATSTAAQQLVDAFNAKYAGKDITDESALKQKIADYADLSDQVAKANAAWEKASAGEKQKAQAEAAAKAKEAQEAQVNAAKKQAAEAKAKHAEYMKELGISDAEADGFKGLVEMFGGKSKDLIADFQSYAKQAKNNLGGSGITGFEAALIANYKSSSQVNEELRKPSASWSASKWAYSKVLNSALSKLPKYNGVVIRNTPLTTDLQGRYKPGHVVLEHGFTGASDKKPHGVFSGNTRFYITAVGKRAASIKNAFGFEGEGEVLFQARTAFLVDKVEGTPGGSGDASYKVYMTEVEY